MRATLPSQLLADFVLTVHVGVVVFVVGGLAAVLAGNRRGWGWVNGLGFRAAHLAAILFVVAESWVGAACPLTTLEAWLRVQGGGAGHAGGFVGYWLQRLLYYDAPEWVFIAGYTAFAAAVAAAWWRYPPRRGGGPGPGAQPGGTAP